jgi:HAD superfamily hydrolase (TIGR01549 family)
MTSFPLSVDTVLLDVDGTLVDSNYHLTMAWWRAFRDVEHPMPGWRIHRSIGMGGDRLVAAVAGDDVEEKSGDQVREAWEGHYDDVLSEVVALPEAHDLVVDLQQRGFRVALASSGLPKHTRHALDVLEAREHVDTTTTSEDAEESKPHPELVQVALDEVDATRAVLVGDSVWDVRSATEAGLPVIGVLCGGFGRAELKDDGAVAVCADVAELRRRLDELLQARD